MMYSVLTRNKEVLLYKSMKSVSAIIEGLHDRCGQMYTKKDFVAELKKDGIVFLYDEVPNTQEDWALKIEIKEISK